MIKEIDDWELVLRTWISVVNNYYYPSVKLFASPKELRKYGGRGIDFALRRLLDSGDRRIRVYGAPSSLYPRNPFWWNGKKWALISVRI